MKIATMLRRYLKVVRKYRYTQPKAVATLRRDFRFTVAYFRLEQRFPTWPRQHLRTTSSLERFNCRIRRRLRAANAYHSDHGLLAMLAASEPGAIFRIQVYTSLVDGLLTRERGVVYNASMDATTVEPLPRIRVIATGGTIAMRIDAASGGPVPSLGGSDLMAAVPALDAIAQIEVEEFANIPSERMRPENWCQLAERVQDLLKARAADGIIILHGTDTMEETAFFLDITVPTEVPIVLTGAMRAASDPRPDGPANIREAAIVATHPDSRGRGVLIVMHGEIHSARRGTKIDTAAMDAFESIQPPDLGRVIGERVSFSGGWTPHVHVPLPESLPRVDIVPMYAGADDFALRAALQRGAAGLVIAGVGAGNVNEDLFGGILDALAAEIPVVISSRVPYGGVRPIYAYAGGGVTLLRAGAIFANDLNPQKSRVLLMVGLAAGYGREKLASLFAGPAGPMS